MATDDPKLALARIRARAELKSETGEEDSVVIDERAKERVGRSVAAPAKSFAFVLNAVKSWPQAIVALAIVGAVVYLVGRGAKLW